MEKEDLRTLLRWHKENVEALRTIGSRHELDADIAGTLGRMKVEQAFMEDALKNWRDPHANLHK